MIQERGKNQVSDEYNLKPNVVKNLGDERRTVGNGGSKSSERRTNSVMRENHVNYTLIAFFDLLYLPI